MLVVTLLILKQRAFQRKGIIVLVVLHKQVANNVPYLHSNKLKKVESRVTQGKYMFWIF